MNGKKAGRQATRKHGAKAARNRVSSRTKERAAFTKPSQRPKAKASRKSNSGASPTKRLAKLKSGSVRASLSVRVHYKNADIAAILQAIEKARGASQRVAMLRLNGRLYEAMVQNPQSAKSLQSIGCQLRPSTEIRAPQIATLILDNLSEVPVLPLVKAVSWPSRLSMKLAFLSLLKKERESGLVVESVMLPVVLYGPVRDAFFSKSESTSSIVSDNLSGYQSTTIDCDGHRIQIESGGRDGIG